MKKVLALLALLYATVQVSAQSAVILQHNGNATAFYNNIAFQNACAAAVSGDTILLPGGFFTPPATIDKKLTIIGAGHHPDSSLATKLTVITGSITLLENADGCFISGMRIEGYVRIPSGHSVDMLTLSRLYITDRFLVENGKKSVNGTVRECIVSGEFNSPGLEQFSITNNIFGYRIYDVKNSLIANNIFLAGDPIGEAVRSIYNLDNCVLRNNIFFKSVYDLYGFVSTQIQNNVYANTPVMTGNFPTGNFFNVNTAALFVSYNNTGFAYSHDFHLNTPANYVGTDATQVGLYGSAKPWKNGSVPALPHIISKIIAEQADAEGKIQVQVTVAAQNN
jgi:hypothetical protein